MSRMGSNYCVSVIMGFAGKKEKRGPFFKSGDDECV